MNMEVGGVLSDDIKKVLDLLEYAFDARQIPTTKYDSERVEIDVEFMHIARVGLRIEFFSVALYSLSEQFPQIEIISTFDFVNESVEVSEMKNGVMPTVALLVVPLQFKELLREIRKNYKVNELNVERTTANTKERAQISLGSHKVIFSHKKASIAVGDRTIRLPPQKNEYDLCGVMFKHPLNTPVDWSAVYQQMMGLGELPDKKSSRTVQDTMYRVNNRIKEEIGTEDNLFSWDNKSIKRNF